MAVSTVVWIGYMVYTSMGLTGGLTEILDSEKFQFMLTNGSVYGFAAGIVTFFLAYLILDRKNPVPIPEEKPL